MSGLQMDTRVTFSSETTLINEYISEVIYHFSCLISSHPNFHEILSTAVRSTVTQLYFRSSITVTTSTTLTNSTPITSSAPPYTYKKRSSTPEPGAVRVSLADWAEAGGEGTSWCWRIRAEGIIDPLTPLAPWAATCETTAALVVFVSEELYQLPNVP